MSNLSRTFPNLSRRGFLITGGLAITGLSAFAATPGCSLTAEQEEGPYYIDDEAVRRDITEGRPGVPILLSIRLVDSKRCAPLANTALDIWHCDALGVYSGFTAMSPNGGPGGGPGGPPRGGPGGPPRGGPGGPGGPPPGDPGRMMGPPPNGRGARQIDPTRFLRGVQVSNSSGLVEFSTVYPGWYSGRAIHIHMKAHVGGHVAHTGQLFFPEDLTERVARMKPYANRLAIHRTTQDEDHVFQSQHGSECMVQIEKLGKTEEAGFRATATIAIDPEATPPGVGGFGPRRGA